MTYRQAQERYGIQGCSTVLNWLRKYGQLDWYSSKQRSARGEPMKKSLPLTPEQRIKELEQQLAESEVKAQFFEAVVEVMNTEFGTTLTKKQLASLSRRQKRPG